jgi:excinuclease ABC subunit A
MNFLPDVFVTCDVCRGRRYKHETLQVKYKHHSIADVLESTIEEAAPLFENLPNIHNRLRTLLEVGLGYLHLGQSSTTLSGGEAQRVKLSRELSKRQTGQTVYLLDEPTTGLHFEDVRKLLEVLHELVDNGNSVLVIEHNLDVIKTADWVLDLGPEGGDGGGKIVARGTPEDVAKVKESWTGRYLHEALNRGHARAQSQAKAPIKAEAKVTAKTTARKEPHAKAAPAKAPPIKATPSKTSAKRSGRKRA